MTVDKNMPDTRVELILIAAHNARLNPTSRSGSRAVQSLKQLETGESNYEVIKESLITSLQQVQPAEAKVQTPEE